MWFRNVLIAAFVVEILAQIITIGNTRTRTRGDVALNAVYMGLLIWGIVAYWGAC